MLMAKPSIWWANTPFRKWRLERITKKYYFEYFNELRSKIVLEIGCGSGWGAKIIFKYFSPQKIIATDLDPRQIALAKKNVQIKEIVFEKADATKLRYQDKSFDAVFDYGVIHHIPSPEWKDCLNEIYRVLKPEGKVFLHDLSIESLDTIRGKIMRLLTVHPYSKMYKREKFINYLNLIGFKIIKKVEGSMYFTIVAKK